MMEWLLKTLIHDDYQFKEIWHLDWIMSRMQFLKRQISKNKITATTFVKKD